MTISQLNNYEFHDQEVSGILFDFRKKILRVYFNIFDDSTGSDIEKSLTLVNVSNFNMSPFSNVALSDSEVYSHRVFSEKGINKIYFEFLIDAGKQNIEMFAEFTEFIFM